MIEGFQHPNGTHVILVGDTYPKRETIKRHGGVWDANRRAWVIPMTSIIELNFIGIGYKLECRVAAHCHESEGTAYVYFEDVVRGETKLGCGMCDTPKSCGQQVPVLEVLDIELYNAAQCLIAQQG